MKFNTENSLKRFLKRKVKITLGFVVAFMITGTVGYAEVINETISDDYIFENEDKVYIERDAENDDGTTSTRAIPIFVGENNKKITITTPDDGVIYLEGKSTGVGRAYGIQANGQNSEITFNGNSEINITADGAGLGESRGVQAWYKGTKITFNNKITNINVYSDIKNIKEKSANATGIIASDNSDVILNGDKVSIYVVNGTRNETGGGSPEGSPETQGRGIETGSYGLIQLNSKITEIKAEAKSDYAIGTYNKSCKTSENDRGIIFNSDSTKVTAITENGISRAVSTEGYGNTVLKKGDLEAIASATTGDAYALFNSFLCNVDMGTKEQNAGIVILKAKSDSGSSVGIRSAWNADVEFYTKETNVIAETNSGNAEGIIIKNHIGILPDEIYPGAELKFHSDTKVEATANTTGNVIGVYVNTETAIKNPENNIGGAVIFDKKANITAYSETGQAFGIKIEGVNEKQNHIDFADDVSIKATTSIGNGTAISVADNGYTKINETNNKNVTVIGDIDAKTGGNVLINISNNLSSITGTIKNNNVDETNKGTVNLGISNGATWTNTGESSINKVTINGGIINNDYIVTTTENANGIEMTGNNSTLSGNGKFTTVVSDGKVLTVSNAGNILELGKDSSIVGKIELTKNAELLNKGIINFTKETTLSLGANSTFTNENEATVNIASGATMVTGEGTAVNSGVINLADTTKENENDTVSKLLDGGTLINKGTIVLADKTGTMKDEEWNDILKDIATTGTFTNTGMIVDIAGKTIFSEGTVIDNTTTGELIDSGVANGGEAIKIEKDKNITISGKNTQDDKEAILKDISINVEGNLTLSGVNSGTDQTGVLMENISMNVSDEKTVKVTGTENELSGKIILNGSSKLLVSENADVKLSGTVSQGATQDKVSAITIKKEGVLNLSDANIGVGITGAGNITSSGETILKDVEASELEVSGEKEINTTVIDGIIKVSNIVVGTDSQKTFGFFTAEGNVPSLPTDVVNELKLTSTSKFDTAGSLTIKENGKVTLAVDADGNNAFKNTELKDKKVEVKGDNNKNTTDLVLETEKLTGTVVKVGFGNSVIVGDENNKVTVDANSDVYKVKENELSGANSVELVYNTKLYEDNLVLNNINNNAVVVNNLFSQDTAKREIELDKHYSANIYSETVKAAYDNIKLNEEAVESLAKNSEIGKWTAEGKALHSKNQYDRNGLVGDYSSEIESTGLMAAFGYGIDENTTAGVAFSGVKQDVDTDGGNADADLFYLGVYGNKVVGNYDFTAGLGYQFGEYDANNNILGTAGDKYDSQALSGYIQGRYIADLGDGVSVQPKVRLGYTYIDQDNAKDSYFGVSDTEISTFDTEVGFDVVKSVQIEKSNVDVKFGVSYIKAMGDTDKEFTGRFFGTETSNEFNVLGAEIVENTVKFNLGAEVTNENGFFYNGGFTYEFGSNDTKAYGVNVGAGYKF